jgi:hypothetical protein
LNVRSSSSMYGRYTIMECVTKLQQGASHRPT